MRINKWLDFLDRVGWTFVQAFVGALVVFGLDSWEDSLKAAVGAGVVAAAKVAVAQRSGSDDLGAAVPGQVIEAR